MDTTFWNETTGEPRVWKLTSAVRRRAGGKGPSYWYLACCLSYYDLGEPLPDHSSLTRIRERYGVDVFVASSTRLWSSASRRVWSGGKNSVRSVHLKPCANTGDKWL